MDLLSSIFVVFMYAVIIVLGLSFIAKLLKTKDILYILFRMSVVAAPIAMVAIFVSGTSLWGSAKGWVVPGIITSILVPAVLGLLVKLRN